MHIHVIYLAAILYNDNTHMKYIMNATMRDSVCYYIRLCILLYKGLYYVYIPYVYNTLICPDLYYILCVRSYNINTP